MFGRVGQSAEDKADRADASEWLQDKLKDGPLPAKDILTAAKKEAGISERTLKRAKSDLGIESRREAGTWFWESKDAKPRLSVGTLDPIRENPPYIPTQHLESKDAIQMNGTLTGTLRPTLGEAKDAKSGGWHPYNLGSKPVTAGVSAKGAKDATDGVGVGTLGTDDLPEDWPSDRNDVEVF